MERDLLEAAYRLEIQKSLEKSWDIFVEGLAAHHIDRVIYAVRDDGPVPNWFIMSNLPDDWPRPLTANRDFQEPFVSHCCATFQTSKLGVAFLDQHEGYIDEGTRDYVTAMTRFDWRAGLGIPCRLVGSGRHGGFILGNNFDRHGFERSIMPKADQLQSLCLIAHRKIENWRQVDSTETQQRPLSPREHQVLNLIASGQRPKAIAQHLELSESSVRLYIKNARAKLNVRTNEEAVVRFLQDHQPPNS